MKLQPVVIIGGGRIGTGNVGLAGGMPLSHLAAIRAAGSAGVELRAIVEPRAERRAAILQAWPDLQGAQVVADLADAGDLSGAVAAVCIPEDARAGVIEAAVARGIRGLIIEKPPARSRAELGSLAALCGARDVAVIFNFNRRFDPRFGGLRPRRDETLAVSVRYARGLRNYASHFMDLVVAWFGMPSALRWLSDPAGIEALPDDPSPSFWMGYAGGPEVIFQGLAGAGYDILDMEIAGRGGHVAVTAGGARITRLHQAPDRFYRGYTHLAPENADEGPVGGFVEMYRRLGQGGMGGLLADGCTLAQADGVMAMIEAVAESRRKAGGAIGFGNLKGDCGNGR